jgi:hypothetical protein
MFSSSCLESFLFHVRGSVLRLESKVHIAFWSTKNMGERIWKKETSLFLIAPEECRSDLSLFEGSGSTTGLFGTQGLSVRKWAGYSKACWGLSPSLFLFLHRSLIHSQSFIPFPRDAQHMSLFWLLHAKPRKSWGFLE